jgi:hypothetical protein
MKNNNSKMVNKQVSGLKQHPLLKKLGIESLSKFEMDVNNRFNIPNELIIVTKDNEVISNWEFVEASSTEDINVCELDISKEELILVLATKNLRKKLNTSGRVALELELQAYLTETASGKKLSETLQGSNTMEKIAKMLDCSYGTVEKDFAIYKHAPDLIKELDNGAYSLTGAYEVAKSNRAKVEEVEAGLGKHEGGNEKESSTLPEVSSKAKTVKAENSFPIIQEFAGAKIFKACQAISGITIRYADGTEFTKQFDASYLMESKREDGAHGAEFHQVFNEGTQAFLQLNLKNIESL